MSQREAIIAKALELPRMPMAVQHICTLLNKKNLDIDSVVEVIQYDPALTVNVLSLANSSFFGGVRTFSTVREAAVRLGTRRLIQMVIALGVTPYAKGEIKGYGLSSGQLLEHSIVVALASELLAKVLNIQAPPHTFTSGLLVNIGKVVLGGFLEVDAEPILEKAYTDGLSFEAAEEAVLGINHCELGALLLEHWNLPESIVNVVRWRLKPSDAHVKDLALDLVHTGDILAKMTGIGAGIDGLQYMLCPEVVERLGLSEEHQEEVMAEIILQREELVAILSSSK